MARNLSRAGVEQGIAPYTARRAEETKVFQLVQDHWLAFLKRCEQADKPVASYVRHEFTSFLKCGVLAHGFLRLQCTGCHFERLRPFSCKRRGFCPSCCGRRMNEGSVFLSDNVFPHVPTRQWVLSFPIPVRFWMARNPNLVTQLLAIFHRCLKAHYRKKAKALGVAGDIQTGAVTVVQRFGSALNLNIHFHALLLDGVYVMDEKTKVLKFVEALKPLQQDIVDVLAMVQTRMVRALQRRGLVKSLEAEAGYEGIEQEETIEALCQGASVQYRLGLGKNAGRPVRRIGSLGVIGEDPQPTGNLSAIIGGFSMHANVFIHKNDRQTLERLCRYLLRPPVAEQRLSIASGQVIYELKSMWRDGTRAIALTPLEFIEKLVAIIPQPRIHMTRFHGILAPHAALRSLIVPKSQASIPAAALTEKKEPVVKPRAHRLGWAELLKRIFAVDLNKCPSCSGTMKLIATIVDPVAITQILNHVGLSSKAPTFAPP